MALEQNLYQAQTENLAQVHFINIRLFSRIFVKTDFIHFLETFYKVL